MSVQLQDLITSLVESAPSTELSSVAENLDAITTGISKSTIENAIAEFINSTPIAISGYIISKFNKDSQSSKYIDFVKEEKFNFDVLKNLIIDVESYSTEGQVNANLVRKLEEYGEDYYQNFTFNIIPEGFADDNDKSFRIIIIGQKQNQNNFYTGAWRSEYKVNGDQITGVVALDIHYFEEGNVRLKYTDDEISGTLGKSGDASGIVNFINKLENAIELKIIEQFQSLNQQSFKNLRRVLPVTRSKINWGNAIGNYRLGSDVVNKK